MKIEDVILALQCIAEDGECDCNACAYAEDGNPMPWYQCQKKAAGDAVELLGAQEPRVMALSEVKEFVYGSPYIIEINMPGDERLMYGLYSHAGIAGNFDFATVNERVRLLDSDYAKRWRCWTSAPNDKQREAVKWE